MWDGHLDGVSGDGGEFVKEYREILDVSGKIGDVEKATVEFFHHPSFVAVAALDISEPVARGLGDTESAALMLAVTPPPHATGPPHPPC